MIFRKLDFHVRSKDWGEEDLDLLRPFRLRINHIVDSFSLRIPKKSRTLKIRKLNVCVNKTKRSSIFWELEGIANVELTIPEIESIYYLSQSEAVARVIDSSAESVGSFQKKNRENKAQ